MLLSMTGFGRAVSDLHAQRVTIEIKSVNHRYLDISFNIPRQLTYLEDKMKQLIKSSVNRGKVSVYLAIEGQPLSSQTIETNWPLLQQYIEACQQIVERYPIQNDIGLSDILQIPDIFMAQETTVSLGELEPAILQTATNAIKDLEDMRRREGEYLSRELSERNIYLKKLVLELKEYAPSVKKTYLNRLEKHVVDFLAGHHEIDEQRLLNEVAIFADKSNIDEEITRLASHLEQFSVILDQKEPKGRKFDFLLQEMNREINTIGSKANDVIISRSVVEIKSELEKLREQVQNVE